MWCTVCGLAKHFSIDGKPLVALHCFPKDREKAKKWQKIFPLVPINSYSRICSNHFVAADYENNKHGVRLRKNAMPKTESEIKRYKEAIGGLDEEREQSMLVIDFEKPSMKQLNFRKASVKMCRMCMGSLRSSPSSIDRYYGSKTVAEMINFLSGVQLPAAYDNLPQQICCACVEALLSACRTKELCIDTDTNLRSLLPDDCIRHVEEIKQEPPDEDMFDCLNVSIGDFEINELDSKIKFLDDETDLNTSGQTDPEDVKPDLVDPLPIEPPIIAPTNVVLTYRCYICDTIFRKNKEKLDHLKAAHVDMKLECSICNRMCRTAKALDDHMMLHSNPHLMQMMADYNQRPKMRPSSTQQSVPEVMEIPEIDEIPEETKKKKKKEKKPAAPKKTYKCYICNFEFEYRGQKDDHLYEDHKDIDLRCKTCGRRCRSAMGMDEHLQIHENPELLAHMCYICSKFFRYRYELNAHIKWDHKQAKEGLVYTCDMCGYKPKFKHNLKTHIENRHLNVKRFECDQCPGKRFTNKYGLEIHKTVRHGKKTNIQCKACHRYVQSNSLLKTHRKFCTGSPDIRPKVIDRVDPNIYRERIGDKDTYRCKICGKLFYGDIGKEKLSIHYANMHKYTCDQCPAHYKNKSLLQQHVEKAH